MIRIRHSRHGFTLVELSIVLVIVGLIIGGILVGADLVRSSEMKSVGIMVTEMRTAVNSFKARYAAVPGDMPNATQVWGADPSCPGSSGTTLTCNGNGGGYLTDGGADNEMYRFWQHLALGGFIAGSYTGAYGPTSTVHSIPGTNVPKTRVANVGITAVNMGTDMASKPYLFAGDYSNSFQIGVSNGYQTEHGYMTPMEAMTLDLKFDDGKPSQGRYVMRNNEAVGGNPNCTDSNASGAATAAYMTNVKDRTCGLLIRNAW